jgi:hypothetical protein
MRENTWAASAINAVMPHVKNVCNFTANVVTWKMLFP